MQYNIRRSTYNSSYRQDGIDQAMKLYSVLKGTYRTISGRHSRKTFGVEDFPLLFCRNSCAHDRLPLLFLRFDHSKDLPLAKAKLTSFWNFLSNVGLQGPAIKALRKFHKSDTCEPTEAQLLRQENSDLSLSKEASTNLECSPVFKDLKQIFDMFLSKGLDKTALSIDSNYRVHPFVCMCQEPCCKCVNYSQHLHKLGLHHQNVALDEVKKTLERDSVTVTQLNELRQSMKSIVKDQSQISTRLPISSQLFGLSVDDVNSKIQLKPSKIMAGSNSDIDAEAEEDKVIAGKKSPLDISAQTLFTAQSEVSNTTINMHVQAMNELINENIKENDKRLKCRPSVRSVRRNFKEIEPEKYQNLLFEMIKHPESCLLSYQSKQERVLRPKLIPNDCQTKRPKWRI